MYPIPLKNIAFDTELTEYRINLHEVSMSRCNRHAHPFFEIGYITAGTARHTVHEQEMPLSAGDVFLIDRGVEHYFKRNLPTSPFSLINLCFFPDLLDESLYRASSVNDLAASPLLRLAPDHSQDYSRVVLRDTDGRIRALLGEIARECEEKAVGWQAAVRGLLLRLLLYFFRAAGQKAPEGFSPPVREILRNLPERYMENASILDFCSEKYYSINYLGKKFKEETGLSFKKYLQKTRLEKAASLLLVTDYTVDVIAGAVGYQNVAFFHRLFRAYYGQTPLQYRKKQR